MGWFSRAFGGDARAPQDVAVTLREALLAVLDRDLERAEERLAAAARRKPHDRALRLALGRLCRSRGEIGRAIRIHQTLLLHPAGAPGATLEALLELAADFRQGGFLRRAIASYEEALAHDARHPVALAALIRLYADVRDYPRALEMTRRLARVEGRRSRAEEATLLVEMADAASAEGRSEDARRALRRALRKDRRCVGAWIALGAVEAEREHPRAALRAWRRVPEIDRRSGPRVYPQIEATQAALGRTRDFETLLRRLIAERSEDPHARLALARHLAARGETDAALAELRAVLERAPEHLEARIALGRLLLSAHRDVEAAREYGELLDALERRGRLPAPENLA